MPIDARIALAGRQPQIDIPMNPAEMEMAGLQLASGRNKLMADSQSAKRDSDLNRLYAENYKNGGLDYQNMAEQAKQLGYGAEIPGLIKGQNDQVAAEAEAKKVQIEKQLGLYRTITQLMAGVRDEPTYQAAKQQALQILGPEAEQGMLPNYDPVEFERRKQAAMTMEEQLKQEYQQAQQAIQMRAQDITLNGQRINDENADASRAVSMRNSNIAAQNLGLSRERFNFDKQNKLTGASGAQAGPTQKLRQLPAGSIDKITKVQSGKEAADRLTSSFDDKFGSQPIMGNINNLVGRTFGDDSGQAQWWQDYQLYKNQVRHELFGSALTPTEQSQWEQADINPKMEASEIRKNLKRRNEIEEKALSRQVQNYSKGGYDTSGFNDVIKPEDDGSNDPEYQAYLRSLKK